MLSDKKIFLISKPSLWSDQLYDRLSNFNCLYFNDDSYANFLFQKPDWIFFFHWPKKVPKEIFENNKCVILHTGNLPQGRGGTPIQNQILFLHNHPVSSNSTGANNLQQLLVVHDPPKRLLSYLHGLTYH